MDDNEVRREALRQLVLTATDPTPEVLNVPPEIANRVKRLLLDHMGERGIAAATGLSVDEIRAMLVRLARPQAA